MPLAVSCWWRRRCCCFPWRWLWDMGNPSVPYLLPAALLVLCGGLLSFKKPRQASLFARDGLAVVALAWIAVSLFGALPFYISGSIESFVDCFFETVSGFTTTGATILTEVESLNRGILFWRSFTHWVGGMGVLVFVMAILPMGGDGHGCTCCGRRCLDPRWESW
ncbi:MAG: potassium transporter TrkG [Dysosmobacter welbionis]